MLLFTLLVGALALTLASTNALANPCTKAATFNAALMHQVGNYDVREKDIADGLASTDSDFYCIQEMWLESDVERLTKDLSGLYPHHYSAIHYREDAIRKPSGEMSWWEYLNSFSVDAPCSLTAGSYFLTVVGGCGITNGCMEKFSVSSKEGAKCLAEKCGAQLRSDWVHQNCIECIILMFSSVTAAVEACVPDVTEPRNRLNAPGLLLISKSPISNAQYVSYHPGKDMAVERGYLEAEIEGKKIVCTHPASIDSTFIEYDLGLGFSDYETQNRQELNQVVSTFSGQDHILMGDLNTGPAVVDATNPEKNLDGEFPDNYDILVQAGYKSPYLSQDGRCTYCSDNPLVSYSNQVIDQVLYFGDFNGQSSKRIMDRTSPSPYSDHYGVEVNICPVQPA